MSFLQYMRDIYNRNLAVKDAVDRLPSAVGYFLPDGSIKLCNTAMYELYRALAGEDLQGLDELTKALAACDKTTRVIRDGHVFVFPDGRAWKYSAEAIRTEDNRTYTEAVFSEVTELYEKRRELEQQAEERKKMYAELMELSGKLTEITREQEILNMKSLLHDRMNMGIAAIRKILRQNTESEENAAAVEQFRRAVRILQEENMYPQDDLAELIRDAESAGVRVNISGALPEEEEPRRLLTVVLRESCINAARHADASVLNAAAGREGNTAVLRITNDGRQPEQEIVPRGGLLDLGKQIERAGGTWEIQSLPEFVLTVTLPVSGPDHREGARG